MLTKLKVQKSGTLYLPEELREEDGYTGEVDSLVGVCTLTIIKPGSTLAEARHSLELEVQRLDALVKHKELELEQQKVQSPSVST